MTAWLIDTLLMTGILMVFVLLVRKPVGRWFGPAAAYALWALPMIRLFLPPLVLPRETVVARPSFEVVPLIVDRVPADPAPLAAPVAEMAPAEAVSAPFWAEWPVVEIALAVWLGGAALFLLHRVFAYRAMRAELLRDARRVGHAGRVSIVESPAVAAPLAFGVFDRVVALPAGFLATADSDASDFAIAHELEHHAGNDLVANFAVQPLFALHWFNPLAWMAWRALRSDQEAACDARVMAGRDRSERERYGRLIAEFAVGPRLALAAPMAGPLRGDKPIIHRLKALVRNDVSERRKLLGRSLFAVAVIGVPATATVTYAAVETEGDAPQLTAVDPDIGPAPVSASSEAPWASDDCPDASPDHDCADHAPPAHRVVHREGKANHFAMNTPLSEAQIEQAERDAERAERDAERAGRDAERAGREAEREAERQAMEAERAARIAERDAEQAEREAERRARDIERRAAQIEREAERAAAGAPDVQHWVSADGKVETIRLVSKDRNGKARSMQEMVIDSSCPAGGRSAAASAASPGSARSSVRICVGEPDTSATVRAALATARANVASQANLSSKMRNDIIAQIDAQMAEARAHAD
ncbi:hypothetical protein B2G71_15175 [Novosphingobium sp. PC22D]|uniref:M56 family metallopeptidase n=1 Tax=Novosphingobium sp. PC22D TaxID=1962403 RepID=UPI000BF1AB59|nr:M56 family metallopeptidase [Novosphingobium sp. PC22D]PEQ11788.1 hypothetical protein B2G71_15175 [Novosphingobium sp. PC22D]